jgi:hypothetical protein
MQPEDHEKPTSTVTSPEGIEEVRLGRSCTIERICAELAKLFGVRRTEVGMLRVEGDLLSSFTLLSCSQPDVFRSPVPPWLPEQR